jgi:anaerobic magnesium-protoporphyrin IX monomethyl ester cyclase
MVGLPNETPETHMDTVRLNQAIAPDVASIFVFFPYPGTELYDYCIEHGLYDPAEALPENYTSRRDSVLTLPDFPHDEISKCFRRFGFRVFKRTSPVKAIALTIMHSRYGELFLNVTKKLRRVLRRIVKGY